MHPPILERPSLFHLVPIWKFQDPTKKGRPDVPSIESPKFRGTDEKGVPSPLHTEHRCHDGAYLVSNAPSDENKKGHVRETTLGGRRVDEFSRRDKRGRTRDAFDVPASHMLFSKCRPL